MGGVLSSGVLTATSKQQQQMQRSTTTEVFHADWSGLPEDLLLIVMGALDVPSLVRAGGACSPWRATYATFRRLRLPSPRQAPCLLYAREDYGPNHVAMYSPTTGETFRVPLAGPPHHRRGLTVSTAVPGWVFTTDSVGDPYLLNPLTGARAALPPVKTLGNYDTFLDGNGEHIFPAGLEQGVMKPASVFRARDWAFIRVAVSAGGGAATVLVVHPPESKLSFTRVGDERWTPLTSVGPLVGHDALGFDNVLYNDKDGLFYAAESYGSVYTIDLDGPSPVVTRIFVGKPRTTGCDHTMYIAVAPTGDLVLMDRMWNQTHRPVEEHTTYQHRRYNDAMVDSDIEGNGEEEDLDDDMDEELYSDSSDDEDEEDEEELNEHCKHTDSFVDPTQEILSTYTHEESVTTELVIHKVDLQRQKLVRLRGIGDQHALFLGYNSPAFLPTKDFPEFKPNHAYLTDDCNECNPSLRRDLGIWSFEERRLEKKLSDEWPGVYDWQDLPAPILITPSLY
ncbi:unnamed protein product [Urochloa decumbens]|uniref:KIB1-4 beta-propeller domain-containing protein n=1 Tax=Urochloa decumbens TaxID=240449 RepID=A0ABC8VZ50_9POAL